MLKWQALTEQEIQLEQYAIKLMDMRKQIEVEMKAFFWNNLIVFIEFTLFL